MRDREQRYRATEKGRATRARHARRRYAGLSPFERALEVQRVTVGRRARRIARRKGPDGIS